MGVVGEEADALEEEMARRWVGKSLLSGGFDEGMMGTSRNDGRWDFSRELGMDSKESALRILQFTFASDMRQTR